ncbi:MAG: hypothetical protein AAFQ41_16795 [Cyanobacteria bacterium J06623_7]
MLFHRSVTNIAWRSSVWLVYYNAYSLYFRSLSYRLLLGITEAKAIA